MKLEDLEAIGLAAFEQELSIEEMGQSPTRQTLTAMIDRAARAAIRAVVEDEREACAQLADQWGAGSENDIPAGEFQRRYGYHRNLASAIRARGEVKLR